MNQFQVDWDEAAEEQLADIWIDATDRAAVTKAEHDAERILARDPLGSGIDLSEGLHRVVIDPLIIHYVVDDDQKKVKVTHVAPLP